MNVYRGMISVHNLGLNQIQDIAFDSLINFPSVVDNAYVLCVLTGLLLIVLIGKSSIELKQQFSYSRKTALTVSVFLMLTLICISRGSVFIYFNF